MRWTRVAKYALPTYLLQLAVVLPPVVVLDGAAGLGTGVAEVVEADGGHPGPPEQGLEGAADHV